jgi:hypothetical protein
MLLPRDRQSDNSRSQTKLAANNMMMREFNSIKKLMLQAHLRAKAKEIA